MRRRESHLQREAAYSSPTRVLSRAQGSGDLQDEIDAPRSSRPTVHCASPGWLSRAFEKKIRVTRSPGSRPAPQQGEEAGPRAQGFDRLSWSI